MTDLQQFVEAHTRNVNALIERVVEAALVRGEHGVRVDYTGLDVTARVDPEVPYGHIHEHHHPAPVVPL